MSKRIPYISLLQIIGPIFVVLGHSLNGIDCAGAWYVFSKEWIYIFHMPLFFLVSGYLLSHQGYLGDRTYGQFIFVKTKRLIFPWVFWNILFFLPKALLWKSEAVTLIGFIAPRQNIWTHTWFLVALFILFLATPLFSKLFDARKTWVTVIVLVVCVIAYMFPIHLLPFDTEIMTLSDLHKDLLFFVIGCLLGQLNQDKLVWFMKNFRIWLILGAILSSVASLIWYDETKPFHFVTCTFILFALLSVFVSIEKLPNFWERLSSYSFAIYIMHWPVMLATRVVLYQKLNLGSFVSAFFMVVMGYIVPIAIVTVIRAIPLKVIKKPLKYLLGV